jgi:hypothetical protein
LILKVHGTGCRSNVTLSQAINGGNINSLETFLNSGRCNAIAFSDDDRFLSSKHLASLLSWCWRMVAKTI